MDSFGAPIDPPRLHVTWPQNQPDPADYVSAVLSGRPQRVRHPHLVNASVAAMAAMVLLDTVWVYCIAPAPLETLLYELTPRWNARRCSVI